MEQQDSKATSSEDSVKILTGKAKEALNNMVKDSKTGKMVFQEGLDPIVLELANSERRRRDAQTEMNRSQIALKAEKDVNTKLTGKLATNFKLTSEQQTELEELKYKDVDLWYTKKQEYENQAKANFETEVGTISQEASQQALLESQMLIQKKFNEDHPNAQVLDSHKNLIPPVWFERLEAGELGYQEFLESVSKYLYSEKVILGDPVSNQKSLGNVGGDSKPAEQPGNPKVKLHQTAFY